MTRRELSAMQGFHRPSPSPSATATSSHVAPMASSSASASGEDQLHPAAGSSGLRRCRRFDFAPGASAASRFLEEQRDVLEAELDQLEEEFLRVKNAGEDVRGELYDRLVALEAEFHRLDDREEELLKSEDPRCRDAYERRCALEVELAAMDDREERMRIENGELRSLARSLKAEVEELKNQSCVVGSLVEAVGEDHAVVIPTGGEHSFYVPVLGGVDRALLKPAASVALQMDSHAVVGVLPEDVVSSASVSVLGEAERPSVTYDDVAGCEEQKREVREAVELPLTHPELYARLGVDPPRGVLLHGPPGTGKTMLAKAVAHHTSAAFIHLSAAELVSKRLGEGPRMMREVFRLARYRAPAIVFIDEVDAVAAARFDAASGADREVHRVLMELLAQMDGFDECDAGVRVIMATNRADTLDPALLRPGRVDRAVEFPRPGRAQKREVFRACAAGMSLDGGVDLEELAVRHDTVSAAEIAAVCREAGMQAIRDGRYVVTHEDFQEGYRAVVKPAHGGAGKFDFYS